MASRKVFSILAAGLALTILGGCGKPAQVNSKVSTVKKTVGHAMVREMPSQELFLRPGAGGIAPDGKLVIASSAHSGRKVKRPVDACGNALTPDISSAELNDDQRALNHLIVQVEHQLNNARHTQYLANNHALKEAAKDMARSDKQELERLRQLRRQLCKASAHRIGVKHKIAHARKKD